MVKWLLCCIVFFIILNHGRTVLLAIVELLVSNLHSAVAHILSISAAVLFNCWWRCEYMFTDTEDLLFVCSGVCNLLELLSISSFWWQARLLLPAPVVSEFVPSSGFYLWLCVWLEPAKTGKCFLSHCYIKMIYNYVYSCNKMWFNLQ